MAARTFISNHMRIWTIHPRYLDPQGLVALWRETLLARAVLRGETKGYRNHPQLYRFQAHATPRAAVNAYLASVLLEADSRGYSFNRGKVCPVRGQVQIDCTKGQLQYEWRHLLHKLQIRSPDCYRRWRSMPMPQPHPLFRVCAGPVESWERTQGNI